MRRTLPSPRRSRGFTLVELLIVITIIGVLMALLIPAIAGAIRTARNGQVTAEITNLVAALAQFKDQYGDYPPSRIILSESGSYPASQPDASGWYGALPPAGTNDVTYSSLVQRSQRYMRKFWPKGAFGPMNLDGDADIEYFPDYNGDGVMQTGLIYLDGPECLAFFLGGIPQPTGGTVSAPTFQPGDGLIGFGKDPRLPFKRSAIVGSGGGDTFSTSNRTPPLYEFQAGRLVDHDGDGIPGYIDTFSSPQAPRFLAYFSSYGGNAYDPNDVNFAEEHNGQALTWVFQVNTGVAQQGGRAITLSPAPNPYTTGDTVPARANQPASYINPTTFQIIGAGADGTYGLGGRYVSDATDRLPAMGYPTDVPAALRPPGYPGDVRRPDGDNLTNFNQGTLQ